MKNDSRNKNELKEKNSITRRSFISTAGAITAGFLLNPIKKGHAGTQRFLDGNPDVAVTQALDYSDAALIKQKVQHLFESIGGISDVVSTGSKVAVKINLTGGSGYANNSALQGYDITEAMWTHPAVLRAVCELLLDSGVSADNLYIVEAIWDMASFNNFGYKTVQDELGIQLVNLNQEAPYADFVEKSTGDSHFNYSAFTLNRILDEADVYISIPKMKQHYDAGVTHSLKNQVGMTPYSCYNAGNSYRRHLHDKNGSVNIRSYLPRSIVDLNLARPVNLCIIDGVINAEGGEGVWNPSFTPSEYHLLLAGKDPVAVDSICSWQMGNDPEADKLTLPGNRSANDKECDNYLKLASQVGMGTNILGEINLTGDGANLIRTSIEDRPALRKPDSIRLFANWPNPFNSSTCIRFYMPVSGSVSLDIYNSMGQKVHTLANGMVSSGDHESIWQAQNLPSGVYVARLKAGGQVKTQRLIYQK